jgi:putative ABC transport system ATP-binding protein
MVFTTENVNFLDIIKYPYIEIDENSATFINGGSGCGKSTLLKLFNGTVSPLSGEIFYNGENIKSIDPTELRKQVLLCGQSVFLFDTDIRENFRQFNEYRALPAPDDDTIRKYLSLCSADFPLDNACASMSGGERQRIYTAVFLSFMPRVLMLDEPTSALDTQNAGIMLGNVKSFCKDNGMTLIVVSHDSELTTRFADSVVFLEGRDKQ